MNNININFMPNHQRSYSYRKTINEKQRSHQIQSSKSFYEKDRIYQ